MHKRLGPLRSAVLVAKESAFCATAVARRGLFRPGGQSHEELESKFVVATKVLFSPSVD